MQNKQNYQERALSQFKRKILRIIDQDRGRAIVVHDKVMTQIDSHPQAMLLVGDKATQTLNNLRRHAANMIKMYQIQKKKITTEKGAVSKDILDMIQQAQKEKNNESKKTD